MEFGLAVSRSCGQTNDNTFDESQFLLPFLEFEDMELELHRRIRSICRNNLSMSIRDRDRANSYVIIPLSAMPGRLLLTALPNAANGSCSNQYFIDTGTTQ